MDVLAKEIRSCNLCELGLSRKNPVIGEGKLNSPLVLVGEAPGRREDEQGRPFVGSAGKLLDEALKQVCLTRDEVYIVNVLKCRPPGNRRPLRQEVAACSSHLSKQLELIAPRIVAPMGNSATGHMMRLYGLQRKSIGEVHGKEFIVDAPWGEITLFPLYHPAAILYNRTLEKELVEDLEALKSILELKE
jgi:DNA polymerase